MKKRLISILLVAVLAVSLLAGYSLSANAETVSYSTMTYQMQSGDYVLRICQRLGLNYYTCKSAIMKLNNITDNQWTKLAVGRVLTLPATDADAIVIATGHGSTAAPAASSVTTPVATVSTAAATPKTTYTQSAIDTALSKDICWWYMVPYKLAAGETVTDACNAVGVSYSRWDTTIKRINKISNWNSIPAGTTLWIPTVSQPAKGTNCITVYRHIMQAGETAYGVVTDRGLDYNAVKPMLEIINDEHPNLAKLKEGEPFYYPIATTTSLYSNTTSDNNTITTNSDGTTTIVKTYKLTSAIDTGAANVEFYVNGKQVKEAKAGDTVNVSINTRAGRAAKNVRVKFANGQADLYLKSFSFTMPSCDIEIDADVMKGHNIDLVCNYIGKAATLVDGVSMNAAATGAAVTVTSIDPSLVPTEVYVSYKTLSGIKREALLNIDDGFVMPDADVTVEVTLEAVPTYPFYVIDDENNNFGANGSYTLQVNGNDVTKAAKGAEVVIKAKPNDGYTVAGILVQRHSNGQNVNVFNNTFIMPADAVDVQVIFQPKDNNRILINPVQGGQFYATVGNPDPNPNPTPASIRTDADREAVTNSKVYLNWLPEDAADNSYAMVTDPNNANAYIVIRNSDGLRVPVTIDDTGVWFRMPAGGVTVTGGVQCQQRAYTGSVILDGQSIAQYQDISLYLQADSETLRNEYQITNDGTAPQYPANIGEYVNVTYNVSSKNIALDRYEVWVNGALNATLTSEVQKNSCFLVPTFAEVADTSAVFEVRAYFVSNIVKIAGADIKITGVGTVGMVDGTTFFSVSGVKAGEPFWLSLAAAEGYIYDVAGTNPADTISSIHVYRKDTGGEIAAVAGPIPDPNGTGAFLYGFGPMPADGVTVEVVFEKLGYVLNVTTVDENGNALSGGSYVKITRNNTDTVIDNWATSMNVEYGDSISVALTEVGKSEYEFVSTEVNSFISKNTSFKVSGDYATNPINLIITLKSKSVTAVKNPIALNAAPKDANRGNVNCVITASPSGYSTPDPNTYVDKAYAGDTVAIIPQAGIGYYTDADHVIVSVDGGRMDLTETSVNGQTAYTFDMPSKDYKNIRVEFLPIEYSLTINVIDAATGNTVINMIKASYSGGGTDPDVMLSDSYRPVPYGSTVAVNLSEYAKNLGVTMNQMNATTNKPSVTPGTLPVPDKNKANVAATLANSGDGVKFIMPAGDCTLTVYLNNVPASITPDMVTLPATADIEGGGTLKLKYVTEGGETVLGGSKVESGTKLKVLVDEDLPTQVLDGPIAFLKGTDKLAQADDGAFFTVPANPDASGDYTLTASAKLATKQYKVQIEVENAPDDAALTISVGGGATASIPASGMTLSEKVPHGTSIKIVNTDTSDPDKFDVDGLTGTTAGTTVSGTLEPTGKDDGDTVVLTVRFETKMYTLKSSTPSEVKFYEDAACTTEISEAAENQTVYVKGTPAAGKYVKTFEIETFTIGKETINATDDVASFQVKNTVTDAKIKDVDDKVVSAKITFNNAPSGLKTAVNGTVSTASSVTVSDVKEASKDVVIVLHEPADYAFDNPGGDTDKYSANKDHTYQYTMTVDMSAVNNGDTVNISLDIVAPDRTLPTATSGGTAVEFYDNAACTGTPITTAEDGSDVYFKVVSLAAEKYLTGATIKGTSVPVSSSGICGPYKVNSNLVNADLDIEAPYKTIKLLFDYKGSAESKVELYNGSAQQTNVSSIKVSSNGSVSGTAELSKVKLTTSSQFGTVSGKNVTPNFNSEKTEVTFSLDFAKLANNATVTIEVNVD